MATNSAHIVAAPETPIRISTCGTLRAPKAAERLRRRIGLTASQRVSGQDTSLSYLFVTAV